MMRKIVVVLMVLVMVAGVGVGVYLMQQSTEFREKAAPATTLQFSAETTSPGVGQEFYVYSRINTAENEVIGVELSVSFDAQKLELITATKGSFFTNPTMKGPNIDNTAGTLLYALNLSLSDAPVRGEGVVAILTFKAKEEGSAVISYTDNTIVGYTGETVGTQAPNALIGTSPITINVGGITITSPTQTLSPEPTQPGDGGITITVSPIPTDVDGGEITPTLSPVPTEPDGVGGGPTSTNIPTATLTPIPTDSEGSGGVDSTSTPTVTATVQTTSGSPAVDELPDSGVAEVAMTALGIGIIVLLLGLFLAL